MQTKTAPVKRPYRNKKKKPIPLRFWIGMSMLGAIGLLFLYVEFFGERHTSVWPKGHDIYGIDVSHFQKNVNWQKVQENNISFAFIKATEGNYLKDKEFERHWKEAGQAGIIKGAYHFYRPRLSPEKQASNFIETVQLSNGDLPPVLDVEHRGLKSGARFREELQTWLNLVERAYNTKPILYTNYQFYKDHLEGYFDNYPLWIAHYQVPKLRISPGHNIKLSFWQHTDIGTVEGVEGKVDCNVFYGSMRDLRKLCIEN
ncbi:glycoside hydrolase family 25 protein [Pontibacter vulgaris]|uniref:glycoside hydrolase family 25 protein n=1 Tax=Pontibacter vulgaris TaxID=2905679 RepID=UPI001FA7BB3C|nr:glycoside hydrolase family 25 protein [Pontibacter vulgaris]